MSLINHTTAVRVLLLVVKAHVTSPWWSAQTPEQHSLSEAHE